MEFGEKLQLLRKSKGITQEKLAEDLFVSRTAISKWESSRGYPNIDSLKDISDYFSVSIDELLSAEKLIVIAENENKENIKGLCCFISAILDLFSIALIVLPLYPNEVQGFVYSVSLTGYMQISSVSLAAYWIMYILLILSGIIKLVSIKTKAEKVKKTVAAASLILNVFAVVFLALTREAYAAVAAFMFLLGKTLIFFRSMKS